MTTVVTRPPRDEPVLAVADPRSASAGTATTALWVLGGVAAVAVWLVAFGLVFSGLAEQHSQHSLYATLRGQLAAGTAPLNDAVAEGTPLFVVDSARAGLHQVVVVQGTSSSALRLGPGHQPGTALPGQPGVSLVMGRSSSYGAPFASITKLRAGDKLTVTTGQGRFTYRVEDVRRAGDPFPAALPPTGSQLTLVTSEGAGWRSGWAPDHVVFVDAVQQGDTYYPQPGHGVVTSRDGVLTHDTRGLFPLVLWLQLLAVAVIGGTWAARRWGLWQTWLAAGPVGLAALWGASTELWLLLPNLL